ncbi:MAG: hypothetical protein ACT4O0_03635 [Pseudonocardia sp.]
MCDFRTSRNSANGTGTVAGVAGLMLMLLFPLLLIGGLAARPRFRRK